MKLKYGVKCALIVLWILLPMPLAQAHAVLVFSNPTIGAKLSEMPSTAEVEFDGNLIALGGARTNVLTVQDSTGKQIDSGNSKVSGPILTVGIKDKNEVGIFTVSWRVVSSDGHPVEGSYQFSVGDASVSLSPSPKVPDHTYRESFCVRHRSHILLGFVLVVAIGIWAGFERTRRKME